MGLTLEGYHSSEIMQGITRWQYVDDVSESIDQLTVTFDASKFGGVPPFGKDYKVLIHTSGKGMWTVIATTIDGDNLMTLKLSPVAKHAAIKERRTVSYVSKPLDEILKDTVKPCGYDLSICPSLADKPVTVNRENETAGDFLNRLAKEHGAVSKPMYGKWSFKPKNTKTTSHGKDKPTISITDATRIISISLTKSANNTFKGVTLNWWDDEKAQMVEERRGQAPYNALGKVSKLKAEEILRTYEKYNQNALERVTLVVPTSNPDVAKAFAQGVLNVDRGRFMRDSFVIDSVTITQHTTTIQGSKPNES